MSDDKSDPGAEAAMVARLRVLTQEIEKVRREFQATLRMKKARSQKREPAAKKPARPKKR